MLAMFWVCELVDKKVTIFQRVLVKNSYSCVCVWGGAMVYRCVMCFVVLNNRHKNMHALDHGIYVNYNL